MRYFAAFLTMYMTFSSISLSGELHTIEAESTLPSNPRDLYIDLLKKAIANTIYDDKYERQDGVDWPSQAHTMIGVKRLNNIEKCMKIIIKNNIPGDCVETGVWRGGATILMRGILKAYNITNRLVWVCDSFKGLPAPNPKEYPIDEGLNFHLFNELAVSVDQVKSNFAKYGLLDKQVRFLEGYFKDTLPKAPIKKIALLRLDGDLYESTIDALNNLYSKLSVGGFIIIDDLYSIPQCMQAVADYRKEHNIITPIKIIDWSGGYWQKE